MLHINHVSHTFMGPNGPVAALDPIELQITPGEFISIVGPSGCGKSTLLRIIAGLLIPSHGVVTLNDKVIASPQRQVGLVFQDSNLMPWRTVLENLALPLELAAVSSQERHIQADAMLKRLGLSDFANAYPAELSGGMAQRVAIGRAMIHNPNVLLLDEPFGALDAMTREQMQLELLRLWSGEDKTAIMVTHSITEAVFVADRVLVMSPRPGHIQAEINIPLPRPRHLEMVHDADFGELARHVREHIAAAF